MFKKSLLIVLCVLCACTTSIQAQLKHDANWVFLERKEIKFEKDSSLTQFSYSTQNYWYSTARSFSDSNRNIHFYIDIKSNIFENKVNKPFIKNTDKNFESGEWFAQGCAFIEKLIVKEDDELEANDFLSLRAKPFYKIKEGVYRIIFRLFVVEKIFKGVYFILRDINTTLPKADRISNLKSLFGDEFSEKVMTYEILKRIYPDKCIAFTGKELADKKIDGAPDYYIRKGKNILLFESKDFLIPAAAKSSFNFAQYEKEFEKKLYFVKENGVEKPKAVMQLIKSIKILLRNEFTANKNYNYKEVSIYPILLTHDHQYDTGGFNHLISYWFQAELELLAEEGFFIHKIKPLIVVNIDCIIYHQVALSKNVPLNEVLKLYAAHIHMSHTLKFNNQSEVENYLMSKMTPFSIFMENYFSNKGLKEMPPMLHELGLSLFKNESNKQAESIII